MYSSEPSCFSLTRLFWFGNAQMKRRKKRCIKGFLVFVSRFARIYYAFVLGIGREKTTFMKDTSKQNFISPRSTKWVCFVMNVVFFLISLPSFSSLSLPLIPLTLLTGLGGDKTTEVDDHHPYYRSSSVYFFWSNSFTREKLKLRVNIDTIVPYSSGLGLFSIRKCLYRPSSCPVCWNEETKQRLNIESFRITKRMVGRHMSW